MNISLMLLIVTTLMALSTTVIYALTMAFQRSHNRKSVRPLCNITFTDEGGLMRVDVWNVGLGPMILRNARVIDPSSDQTSSSIFLTDFLTSLKLESLHMPNLSDYAVGSLDSATLFRISSKDLPVLTRTMQNRCLSVEYEDIYEDLYIKQQTFPY